jgi:hypothetical protein
VVSCIRAGWREAKAKDKEIRMLALPRALCSTFLRTRLWLVRVQRIRRLPLGQSAQLGRIATEATTGPQGATAAKYRSWPCQASKSEKVRLNQRWP